MTGRRLVLFAAVVVCLTPAVPAHAEPIGFVERFALAEDREAALSELIPGTPDHYFYSALHHQLEGELERAEVLIERWRNDPEARGDGRLRGMLHRQRLLTFDRSPERTVEHLRRELGIRLDHAPPPAAGERRLPDALDPTVIDPDALVDEAIRNGESLTAAGLRRLAARLAEQGSDADPKTLRWLLERIDQPGARELDQLVTRELRQRRPEDRRFGDLPAHQQLTLDELYAVRSAVEQVADDQALVDQILLRLRPSEDVDAGQQPEAWLAYLQRLETFVRTLPPAYNGLKAATLYHRMRADQAEGRFDRQRLIDYLQLPRQSALYVVRPDEARGRPAPLDEDFTGQALLPPIGDERPLVRSLLEHFLRDADSPEPFAPYLPSEYLRHVFAETKLLYGVGDAERWFAMLPADRRRAVRDRVELTLAPTNPVYHPVDEPSALAVDVKNVDQLIIRIYEIDAEAVFRSGRTSLDTDFDLDGLEANFERTESFSRPSIRRTRERIELPEIEGRGVWMVDLLGGGVRSRAMIRRGQLRFAATESPSGQVVQVIDERRRPVEEARLWVAGQQFEADRKGRIVLPFAAPADDASHSGDGRRRTVLSDGRLAVPVELPRTAEAYRLDAGIHVHRQQLQAGERATLLLRPRLWSAGRPVSVRMIREADLHIQATDQDGITTDKTYDDIELREGAETEIPFRVPPRCVSLSATLLAKVENVASGSIDTLRAARQWSLRSVEKTDQIADLHLARDGRQWVVEVRGRNGEPRSGAVVAFHFEHRVRPRPAEARLQADEAGQIRLGPLPDVQTVRASGEGMPERRWTLHASPDAWPSRVSGAEGEAVRLPLAEGSAAEDLRLWEQRGGQPAVELNAPEDAGDPAGRRGDEAGEPPARRAGRVEVAGGMVVLDALAAGDYRLVNLQTGEATRVQITAGPRVGEWIAGRVRQLEAPRRDPLAVASAEVQEDALVIELAGANPLTRVHVFGGRYLPLESPAAALAMADYLPKVQINRLERSAYVSDRTLDEEYQYVLRRQHAEKYPGNLLPQPSLLVNPWETDRTENRGDRARPGDRMPSSEAEPAQPPAAEQPEEDRARREAESTPNWDFLPDGGVVLSNLRPDEEGRVRVPVDQLGDAALVRVVASNPGTMVERTVGRELVELDAEDRRLPRHFDPERRLAQSRSVVVASAETPLALDEKESGQLQLYATIGSLYRLYGTLLGDPRWVEFEPLVRWPDLSDDEKREVYGRLACHELHVFLYFKDRPFFDAEVRPLIAQKLEPTLVDDWLAERPLDAYLALWHYERSNAFERAVLGRHVDEAHASVLREFREQVELAEDDPEQVRRRIRVALAGTELEETATAGESLSWQAEGLWDREELGLERARARGAMKGVEDADRDARYDDFAVQQAQNGAARPALGEANDEAFFGMRLNERLGRTLYEPIAATRQWAESFYDLVRRGQESPDLVPLGPFWSDWAHHEEGPFVSEHLLRPTATRSEALLALAVTDLPFEASVELPAGEDAGEIAPAHPVAVVLQKIHEVEAGEPPAQILVGQRFEAVEQAEEEDDEEERAAASGPEEYLAGEAYRGQIVLTNPTPVEQTVDVLWQIPAGSLPLGGGQPTDSRTLRLEPFATERIDYTFYFPQAGEFGHYPACVSAEGRLLATAEEHRFSVVEEPTKFDRDAWPFIARSGSAEEIAAALESSNLRKLDLSLVAHRMRDEEVYRAVMERLETNRVWSGVLWAYALLHRDEPRIGAFLQQQAELVAAIGPVFRSRLLEVDPVPRVFYEHLEYAPLVPARAHALRERPEIFNDRLLAQYRGLMNVLAHQSEPSDAQNLELTYYLLLQNRIGEALQRFAAVEPEAVTTRLQYDYLDAYLSCYRGEYEAAEEIARRYAEHPVPRWRARFDELRSQLDQRETLAGAARLARVDEEPRDLEPTENANLQQLARDRRQAEAARRAPAIDLAFEGDRMRVDYRNLSEATVRFYRMDLELLFSKTPFVERDLDDLVAIAANRSQPLPLDGRSGRVEMPLPRELVSQPMLVQVIGDGASATELYQGGRVTTHVAESFGQLQTLAADSGQPVVGAYVKVYARHADGAVRFYKDGYTDMRGRFDYVALSAPDSATAREFAILVLAPDRGASLHEVKAPTE